MKPHSYPGMPRYLERIRRLEIEAIRQWFPAGTAVLEIGGNTGLQAEVLTNWGCRVMSVDIHVPRGSQRYFRVLEYDGLHVPAADGVFDMVYSSHMLYYELDIPEFFAELRRVLKPGGMAIHVMPTCAWRLATCAAYYPYLLTRIPHHLLKVVQRRSQTAATDDGRETQVSEEQNGKRWWQWFVCSALDPKSKCRIEFQSWQRKSLTQLLRRNGFETLAIRPLRLFYTQYGLLAGCLSNGVRRSISGILGSASTAYITRLSSRNVSQGQTL
jgi:SAM-dependent methyltransferase